MLNSHLVKVKRDQLVGLNKRSEALIKDYLGISTQLTTVNVSSIDHNYLIREQESIDGELQKLAQEIDNLNQEIYQLRSDGLEKNIRGAVSNLVTVCNSIAWQTIKEAYRAVCQRGEIPETTENLLLNLAEMAGPDEEDRNKPLWLFVDILRQNPSLNPRQKNTLEQLLLDRNLLNEMENSDQAKEYYLMVKVAYIPANRTYDIAANLVRDPDPLNHQLMPPTTTIDVPPASNPDYAPEYTKNELFHIVGELIAICAEKHHIPIPNLTVQLFLPIEFISLPIEHKQFQKNLNGSYKPCIGSQCKGVIVRSYDRHFSESYKRSLPEWKQNWQRYSKNRQLLCQDTLHPPTQWTTPPNGVGSKFVEPDKPEKGQILWDELLGDGIPIALWVRQPTDSQNAHSIMQAIIDKCSLTELPNRLKSHRKQHISHKVDEATRLQKFTPLFTY